MKELYRFRQFLTEGVIKENISSHKEEAKRFLEKFVDDNEDKFEFIPDLETGYIDANDNSYNVDELASIFLDIGQDIPRGTHNQKYKGEGGTYVVVSEGVIKENEEQGYTLYDTKVEYDNGKTGYMFQLVNSEDREENEIGFDQLFFDDEDNRLEMGVDFNSFDQGSYQEGEYTADEAMELYRKISEGVIKEDYKNDYANSEEDYTDKMVVEKIKDIIKYHELDPQDLIDEIRIEFGVDAMD